MKEVKARKRHQCLFCFQAIPKGMVHSTWTLFPSSSDVDSPWTGRGHTKCMNLWDNAIENSDELYLPDDRQMFLKGLARIKAEEPDCSKIKVEKGEWYIVFGRPMKFVEMGESEEEFIFIGPFSTDQESTVEYWDISRHAPPEVRQRWQDSYVRREFTKYYKNWDFELGAT